jgi:hypothetical protein
MYVFRMEQEMIFDSFLNPNEKIESSMSYPVGLSIERSVFKQFFCMTVRLSAQHGSTESTPFIHNN